MITQRKTTEKIVQYMIDGLSISDNALVLEPSAGSGDLADILINSFPSLRIECVELNKESRKELIRKGHKVVGEDFFKFYTSKRYDYIIMCPTYKNNVDVHHIMRAYELLKNDGILISLTHPAWTTQNGEHQIIFREWLKDKMYSLKMLPDNSFIENGKTNPSMVITIVNYETI